jgi:hypothetical protein
MEFTAGTTGGLFVAVIALGIAGLVFAPIPMGTSTILMMVLPSMVVFGLITFALGLKHGAYRATN